MERLGPPLVGRDAEAGHGGGRVGELPDLLREREERDEGLSSMCCGERGVAEGVGAVVRRLAWELCGFSFSYGGSEEEE